MRVDRPGRWVFISALLFFGVVFLLPLGSVLGVFLYSSVDSPAVLLSVIPGYRGLVLLGRSLGVGFCSMLVSLAIGLPAAFCLAGCSGRVRKFFMFLVFVPLLVPAYIMAGAWIHLLSPSGSINTFLGGTFGDWARLNMYTFRGCVWCLGVCYFPLPAIIICSGLCGLDSELVDVCRLYGGRRKVFFCSILPQILPYLVASCLLVMVFVLSQYSVPSLLGVNTYPVEIFAQFSAFYDMGAAVGTSFPLIAIVILLILFQRRLMRGCDYVRIGASSGYKESLAGSGFGTWCGVFVVLIFCVTVLVPFGAVAVKVGGVGKFVLVLAKYRESILVTGVLSFFAAAGSLLIAYPVGRYIVNSENRWGVVLDVVCWVAIAVPGAIMALGVVGMKNFFMDIGVGDNFGVFVLLAYIGMFCSFAIKIIQAAASRVDPNVFEAGELDCVNGWQRFLYIGLPVYRGSMLGSFVIVFVLCAGELSATVLLIPPGRATLSVDVDNLLHYGANVEASVLCLGQGVGVFVIIIGMFLFGKVFRRKIFRHP